jgi:hypothetical protein
MIAQSRRAVVIALLLILPGFPTATVAFGEEKKAVALTIDYGDGVQKRFAALAWKDGITIADLMETAAKHPRGIKYVKQGSGTNALLTEIDGLANGTDDKYWLYEVNGTPGDRSYGAMKLKAGDAVQWKFEAY